MYSDHNSIIKYLRLDALLSCSTILHVSKCKTVFRITVAFGNNVIDCTTFLKESLKLSLDILEISLYKEKRTFPSRLVIKSLPEDCFSSDLDRSLLLGGLD
jgi:hypothetical protein